MSHQLCQTCNSNQFEHIDGRLYCIVCQSQNLSLQIHVSFANEGNVQLGRRVHDQSQTTSHIDTKTPKVEIFESNERILSYKTNQPNDNIHSEQSNDIIDDDNQQSLLEQHVWSSYEVYSYILNIQVKTIINLHKITKEKEKEFIDCTFMLYLRYLSSNGILDTIQKRSSNQQEIRRLQTNVLSKSIYEDRYDQFAKLNTHILKKKICPINLDILIGLIHCASTLINCPILIKQLIEWINTNQLPYYNIKSYLPNWMRPTGRDRYYLEKMTIHCGNLFFYYTDYIQPIIKPYLYRCLFQTSTYFYEILMNYCQIFCEKLYFPYDDDIRILFESICKRILKYKSNGRHFLNTSFHIELSVLSMIIIIILIRSINDNLLDEFIQTYFENKRKLFSYSLWLKNLNQLNSLETIRSYQFYGRTNVLMNSITDNHSKLRYTSKLSKIFNQNIEINHNQTLENVNNQENLLKTILIENSKPNSLIYVMKTRDFFAEEFPYLSTNCMSTFFEHIVNTYSPSKFSIVDKSELYETFLSLLNGATITQIEDFYLLHQRFDEASSSNYHLNYLLSTLTRFCSIPYDQEFHSFLSKFLKKICFHDQHFHRYFHESTLLKRINSEYKTNIIGMKKYGTDHLPIMYDLKFEQQQNVLDKKVTK